jgi:hypothetical protein
MEMSISHVPLCEEVNIKDMPKFLYMPDGSYYKIDNKNYAVFMYNVMRQLNDYHVDFDSGYTVYMTNQYGLKLHYF